MPPTSGRRYPLGLISHDELSGSAAISGVSLLDGRDLPDSVKLRTNGRQCRILRAKVAEDGHSLAEQAVYDALWSASLPLDDIENADRTIRIGYHKLAQVTRLSWVTVKANLRSLERKLAIEVIASENSAAQEGKCYRVYSRAAILERRRSVGLEWVRRSRGVELLTLESLDREMALAADPGA